MPELRPTPPLPHPYSWCFRGLSRCDHSHDPAFFCETHDRYESEDGADLGIYVGTARVPHSMPEVGGIYMPCPAQRAEWLAADAACMLTEPRGHESLGARCGGMGCAAPCQIWYCDVHARYEDVYRQPVPRQPHPMPERATCPRTELVEGDLGWYEAPPNHYVDIEGEYDPDCRECREERGEDEPTDSYGRHSYHYVPPTVVYRGTEDLPVRRGSSRYPKPPTSEPYLGLEVEFEAVRGDMGRLVQICHDTGLGWCGTDGSLSHGVEWKLAPSTYARLADSGLADALMALRDEGARAWVPGTCGLHIHISNRAFDSKSHQWRFVAAHERLSPTLKKLAGRKGDPWSKWPKRKLSPADERSVDDQMRYYYTRRRSYNAADIASIRRSLIAECMGQRATKIVAGKEASGDRYVAVNVQAGARTTELRYWRGSLLPAHVLGAAALEDAFYLWSRHMSYADVRSRLTWKAFTAWAVENLPDGQLCHLTELVARRPLVNPHYLPTSDIVVPETEAVEV